MPTRTFVIAFAAALVIAVACAAPPPARAAGPLTQTFGSGAWTWFSDPRAVFYDGRHRRSYTAWVTARGDAMVGSYDHDTNVISTVPLKYNIGQDDHASPTLLLLPRGRLMIFYSRHGGRGIYYRLTQRPEDISALERERKVPHSGEGKFGATYPSPVRVSRERGRIYLFWRGGDWQPMLATSRDGVHWTRPRTLIDANIPRKRNRPYLKVAADDRRGTIHLAFTEAHPGRYSTGIFYAGLRRGRLVNASGQPIGTMPLTPDRAERVYDPQLHGDRAWIYDVAAGPDGRPVMVYDEIRSHSDHRYRYAWWNGNGWDDHVVVSGGPAITNTPGWYSAGISLDHEDPRTVYLSRKVDGQYEIERWQTDDHGTTWRSHPITEHSTQPNLRPVSPRGLKTDDVLFWLRGDYPDYTHFRTSLWMIRAPSIGG